MKCLGSVQELQPSSENVEAQIIRFHYNRPVSAQRSVKCW